jgi:hypothetical protein
MLYRMVYSRYTALYTDTIQRYIQALYSVIYRLYTALYTDTIQCYIRALYSLKKKSKVESDMLT